MNRVAPPAARLAVMAMLVSYLLGAWLIAATGIGAALRTADAWAHRPVLPIPTDEGPSAFAPGEEATLDGIPIWGGSERINVLLLGIDTRPDEVFWEPGRTDFIAVATIDPLSRSAGLISFPRDLWVPIPVSPTLRFEERVNAAYRIGELERAPGGGPAVARRMIEYNFGIRTHFYVVVDFNAFVRAIDRIGGITVDIERPLKDNLYPTDYYGTKRIYYAPGLQWLDGRAALEYARSRHQDNDFERNRRQQKLLLALRQKALDLNLLPLLPHLLLELRNDIRTDMSPAQIMALARLAAGIDLQDVTLRSIGLEGIIRVPGELYFVPNRPVVSSIIADVFTDPRVRREAAHVVIVTDATRRPQARRLASFLGQRGMTTQIEERSADVPPAETVAIDYTGKPATLRYLAEQLKLSPAHVIADLSGLGAGDIEIHIGPDLRLP